MPETPLAAAQRLLTEAVDALAHATGPAADDAELIGVLTLTEAIHRRTDQAGVAALAHLQRRGSFAERGYRNPATALADLLGWEPAQARRHLSAAEHTTPRVGLDGTPLPPRLPATAAAFTTTAASLRHVEIIPRLLGTDAATQLTPAPWAAAEAQLDAWTPDGTPRERRTRA